MEISEIWEMLARPQGGTIVYLVLDGLGGLPDPGRGRTELQVAHTPHLDQLATQSSCGLLDIVGPGITPGSGPGHLALFGYDPLTYTIGRGVLSALGIEFALREGDVAARVNFASVDAAGRLVDRRAGRIDTATNRRLCEKIRQAVTLGFEGEYFFETVSEHRAVLILRGPGLAGNLYDTDPQSIGVQPYEPRARTEDAEHTAQIVRSFVAQVRDVLPPPGGLDARFQSLQACYGTTYSFYFLHVKHPDSRGEDADFDAKVQALEAVDRLLPQVTALDPDVLVVTGDHSTPAVMGRHSWHPVPVLLRARTARIDDVACFDEYACARGILGLRPGLHLMGLALAHAGRLKKYGA